MFKLLRYFSITSLIAFVIVVALLGVFYRQLVLNNLIEIAESKNVALTQAFSNSLWRQFAPFVGSASALSPDEIRAHPEIARLRQAVLAQMEGLSVVKVKVYNLDGLTVFSTEAKQIGEDKSQNAGFLAARSGQVASELTHRDTFSAFESVVEDRDVFSSYIPIRRGGSIGPVEGVFEVYDDVTPLIQQLDIAQRNVIIGVMLILATLYLLLFFIVRRANSIIHRQYNDLKQSGEALAEAHKQALEASQLKTQLLANVSHDLRTPLNAVLGYVDMLQAGVYGPLSAKQHGVAQKIMNSTAHLTQMVNELLDQAQLEAGMLRLTVTPVSPASLINHIQATMGVLAETKGLQLRGTVAANVPASLSGDVLRLQQIVANLVGNAIKFTEDGSVCVSIYRPDETQWAIAVSDTGPGIPTEAQPHLFDAFWQADRSTMRRYSGFGLGLSIVKELTTLMGGEVNVVSTPGEGSTFTVCLPLITEREIVA